MLVEHSEANHLLVDDPNPMNFVVHLGFPPFFLSLRKGCTVYTASYTLKDDPKAYVILTSDAGVSGGVVHALRLIIEVDGNTTTTQKEGEEPKDARLEVGSRGRELVEEFLTAKGVELRIGSVLMTNGLDEALNFWSALTHTLQELTELLEKGKDRELT